MIRSFLLFGAILLSCVASAGCMQYCGAGVNGITIFSAYLGDSTIIRTGWVGHCYVDSVKGDIFIAQAHVYFHPGDTIYVSGKMVTEAGQYTVITDVCENVTYCSNFFTCSYFTDTMASYYYDHFYQPHVDSVAAERRAFEDSIDAIRAIPVLPAIFYPNPVKDVAVFQCFQTVQAPFDFAIYDTQGRCVLSRSVEFTDSYQSISIDVSTLQSGTYVAKYIINDRPYTKQIVKL